MCWRVRVIESVLVECVIHGYFYTMRWCTRVRVPAVSQWVRNVCRWVDLSWARTKRSAFVIGISARQRACVVECVIVQTVEWPQYALTKHALWRSNPLVEYMLNGTAIKEALANGKDTLGRDCDTLYPGCPLDRTSINGVLNKFLPNAGEQHWGQDQIARNWSMELFLICEYNKNDNIWCRTWY